MFLVFFIMELIYSCLMVFAAFTVIDMQSVTMPPECEGQDYCTTKPPNYDDNKINELTKNIMTEAFATNYQKMEPVIFGDDVNCWSETKVDTPYIIRARINSSVSENRLVAQPSSKYFQQVIKITSCWDKKKPCFQEIAAMTDDIETKCEEHYTTVTLYIYDETEGKIMQQPFDIPVSCNCKVLSKYGKK